MRVWVNIYWVDVDVGEIVTEVYATESAAESGARDYWKRNGGTNYGCETREHEIMGMAHAVGGKTEIMRDHCIANGIPYVDHDPDTLPLLNPEIYNH